jgi:hypothetical protein
MRAPIRSRQHGAALAVGLIFLLLMLILGLTAVRSTTQQSRMAANYQFHRQTFDGAETAIRGVIGEARADITPPVGTLKAILVEAADPATADPVRTFTVGTGVSSTSTTSYLGQAPAPGYSMGVGAGSIVAHRFQIEGQSAMANTSAQAIHDQGIQRIGPGGS